MHFSFCAGLLLSGAQITCKQSYVCLHHLAFTPTLVIPQDLLTRAYLGGWTQCFVRSSLRQAADTLPSKQLRQYSSVNNSLAGSRGETYACALGPDSTVDDAAASLQAFTKQLERNKSRHILAVAKHVAEWRKNHEGAAHQSGAAIIHVSVADFAQQAADALLLRRNRRLKVSMSGTAEGLRASTGLAEILQDPGCPALPFAARQTAASQSGSPAASCVHVLNYITALQDILERQVDTAKISISSTETLTALHANMVALNAVAAANGAPQPEVSKQINKCTVSKA